MCPRSNLDMCWVKLALTKTPSLLAALLQGEFTVIFKDSEAADPGRAGFPVRQTLSVSIKLPGVVESA